MICMGECLDNDFAKKINNVLNDTTEILYLHIANIANKRWLVMIWNKTVANVRGY